MAVIKSFISGGAIGADSLFGVIGEERNISVYHMSFPLHNCVGVGNRVILSSAKLELRKSDLDKVRKLLGKKPSRNPYVENLMLRNMFQIKSVNGNLSDLVIAVAKIKRTGDSWKFVEGGTGYAVCYAMLNRVPVIVLDPTDNRFYYYNYEEKTFMLLGNKHINSAVPYKDNLVITGIGSRDINSEIIKPRIDKLIDFILGEDKHEEPISVAEPKIYNLPDEEVPVPMVQGTLY